jgi:hypothetical protein
MNCFVNDEKFKNFQKKLFDPLDWQRKENEEIYNYLKSFRKDDVCYYYKNNELNTTLFITIISKKYHLQVNLCKNVDSMFVILSAFDHFRRLDKGEPVYFRKVDL